MAMLRFQDITSATSPRNRIERQDDDYGRKHSLYGYLFPFQLNKEKSGCEMRRIIVSLPYSNILVYD
ncbi:MAG: hypothetical protein AB1442_04465 [Nitrospirota bacterium]